MHTTTKPQPLNNHKGDIRTDSLAPGRAATVISDRNISSIAHFSRSHTGFYATFTRHTHFIATTYALSPFHSPQHHIHIDQCHTVSTSLAIPSQRSPETRQANCRSRCRETSPSTYPAPMSSQPLSTTPCNWLSPTRPVTIADSVALPRNGTPFTNLRHVFAASTLTDRCSSTTTILLQQFPKSPTPQQASRKSLAQTLLRQTHPSTSAL